MLNYLTVADRKSCQKATDADVAQSVERRLGKAEVTGSIPVISFFVAQKDRQSIDFIDILAVFDLFITEKGTNKGYFIIHRGALGRINTVNIDFL